MPGAVVCHATSDVRERLVTTARAVPALSPVSAAATVEELLDLVRDAPPAIVLLDAHLPGAGPTEAVRRLRATAERTAVVLLAQPGDEVALGRALAIGARGFLAPDVGVAELAAVAAHVLASAPITAGQDAPLGPPWGAGVPGQGMRRPDGPGPVGLTEREVEVLVGMSNGRSNAQIGAELYLSEDTVKTHARRMFRKLGASDRAQAVAIGLRRGLIP